MQILSSEYKYLNTDGTLLEQIQANNGRKSWKKITNAEQT